MKLIRFGEPGKEKPGVLVNNVMYDVSDHIQDYNESFFGEMGMTALQELMRHSQSLLPVVGSDVRLGSPVARPSKIICIGLNYAEHAKENGMSNPEEPVVFFKSTSAITGPYDNLVIPKNSTKTDWEVELAVVIGKKASYITEEEAVNHIGGFMLHNDYSEREYQLNRGGQWVKGKSCDSFAPLGPWLVTADEIPDMHNLRLWLKVNDHLMQDGNTSDMIFNIPFLISYLSQFMTLLPGDVISTGTPAGVGMGQKPAPHYLKAGDIIELGIEGLGTSKQLACSL